MTYNELNMISFVG